MKKNTRHSKSSPHSPETNHHKPLRASRKAVFSRWQTGIFALLFALIGGYAIFRSFAASSPPVTIYLTPVAASVQNGNNLTVEIRENSAAATVDTVQANLSYPTDKFEDAVIVDSSSSAFHLSFQEQAGGGTIQLARSSSTAITGDVLIARVTFRAKAAPVTGTANVSFTGGTEVIATDGNIATLTINNASYTVTAIPPGAPTVSLSANPTTVSSGGSSTLSWSSTNATSCSASNGWSGSKSTSGSESTGALSASKTYTLSCNGPGGNGQASTTVTVTSSGGGGGSTNNSNKKTGGGSTGGQTNPPPSSQLGNSSNPVDNGETTSPTIPGQNTVDFSVKVVDKKNKPVSGAKVTFASQSKLTDKTGYAILTLAPGKYSGTVEYKGHTAKADIEVKPGANLSQLATLKAPTTSSVWWYILPIVLILVLGGTALAWERRRQSNGPSDGEPGGGAHISGEPIPVRPNPSEQIISPTPKPDGAEEDKPPAEPPAAPSSEPPRIIKLPR